MKAKPLPNLTEQVVQKFWELVDVRGQDECWPWKGGQMKKGYGRMRIGGRNTLAHRIALAIASGRDPFPLGACHTCDTPPCCNGRHLFAGTNADNLADMRRKGRQAKGSTHGTQTKPDRVGHGERNAMAKLTAGQVIAIRFLADIVPIKSLAYHFSANPKNVGQIIRGMRWRTINVGQLAS